MKAVLSPLRLHDFAVVNCSFKFITTSEELDIKTLFSEYLIDIDYVIVPNEQLISVFIKTAINQSEDSKPGYVIFAEGVAIYELDENGLSKDDKNSLLQYSAVSIALNSLRGFISTLTANAPLGRYILPSIDVNKLFELKAKRLEKSVNRKKKKK